MSKPDEVRVVFGKARVKMEKWVKDGTWFNVIVMGDIGVTTVASFRDKEEAKTMAERLEAVFLDAEDEPPSAGAAAQKLPVKRMPAKGRVRLR